MSETIYDGPLTTSDLEDIIGKVAAERNKALEQRDELLLAIEEVRPLVEVGLDLTAEELPQHWPSLTCQNPLHRELVQSLGWRCEGCGSGWWAADGEDAPASYHVDARLYLAARRIQEAEGT
jgi:hypothetical protein